MVLLVLSTNIKGGFTLFQKKMPEGVFKQYFTKNYQKVFIYILFKSNDREALESSILLQINVRGNQLHFLQITVKRCSQTVLSNPMPERIHKNFFLMKHHSRGKREGWGWGGLRKIFSHFLQNDMRRYKLQVLSQSNHIKDLHTFIPNNYHEGFTDVFSDNNHER